MVQEASMFYSGSVRAGSRSLIHFPDGALQSEISTFMQGLIDTIADRVVSSVSLSFDGEIRQYNELTGNLVGVTAGTPYQAPGIGNPPQTADNVAMYARLLTNSVVGGRRLSGGIFISGIPASAITAVGDLAEANRAALQADLQAVVDGAGIDWVVWSRTHAAIAPVQTVVAAALISQQRRRRTR